MTHAESTSLRGILNPGAEGRRFVLARHAPSADVGAFVERYWSVRWAFAGDDSYLSETLPHPTVNVVFENGGSAVHGIPTERWARRLVGEGRVLGVKFRPGAFAPFFDRPIHELTNRVLPLERVFGRAANDLDAELLALDDDATRIAVFEAFLRPRLPPRDPDLDRILDVVRLALDTPDVTEVGELAELASVPTRTLQRLFRRHVGVTPKWMLRRFRIQEAAERVAKGHSLDFAALAHDLGYFDQAHFATDFKSQVGRTPTEYAALTRASGREPQRAPALGASSSG